MELQGTIIFDLGITSGTSQAGKPWEKREWVIETMENPQFPKKIKFTVFGERSKSLIFELGKQYAVSVDVESREFQGRWYTDVNAYAMRALDGTMPGAPAGYPQPTAYQQPAAPGMAPAAPAPAAPQSPAADPFAGEDNNTDDLPF